MTFWGLLRDLVLFSESRIQNERGMHRKHLISVPFPLLHFRDLFLAFLDIFQGLRLTSLPSSLFMPSVLAEFLSSGDTSAFSLPNSWCLGVSKEVRRK